MIINLRGTSGAGKSTLVRKVMALYDAAPQYREGRRQPLFYHCEPIGLSKTSGAVRSLVVPGHYETPCGGCDTIKTVDEVYRLVREADSRGEDVLYEGIMVQDDVNRIAALNQDFKRQGCPRLAVVILNTPIDTCIEAIKSRRKAKGNQEPLNPKNTVSRAERVIRNAERLRAAGVQTVTFNRAEALTYVLRSLGWTEEFYELPAAQ